MQRKEFQSFEQSLILLMSRKDNDLRFCDIHSYRHININNMKHDVFVSASDDLCSVVDTTESRNCRYDRRIPKKQDSGLLFVFY